MSTISYKALIKILTEAEAKLNETAENTERLCGSHSLHVIPPCACVASSKTCVS